MIISMGGVDIHINANEWNTAYRGEIIDRYRGNRCRDSEVVMGSLIDGGDSVIIQDVG